MFSKPAFTLSLICLCLAGCATLPATKPAGPDHAELPAAVDPDGTTVPARLYRIVAGGDVLPGHRLTRYCQKHGYGYPFQKIMEHFQSADIGLVNLECPLSERGKRVKDKKFTFRGHPAAAAALKQAGINAVALANNHILDYGVPALEDTIKALDAAGVAHAGAGMTWSEAHAPAKITLADNTMVALLSYSLTFPSSYWAAGRKPGTALARLESMQPQVAAARAWADFVIVCFHWGSELKNDPSPYQIEYGRAAVRAGAQLVVGTHPHVLQGVEWFQEGLILYSLGNLAFGGSQSTRTVTSGLVEITFNGDGKIEAAKFLPLSVDNRATRFIPTPLEGDHAHTLFRFLETHSRPWKTRVLADGTGWGELLGPGQTVESAAQPQIP